VPLEGYIKLELGAGEHPSFGGFVHNDIVAYPHIEIVGDCRQLRTVKPRTVTIIRAIHLLEHFAPTDARSALLVWVSRLCRGGVLEVAVPDLQTLALMAVLDNITIEACLRDVYGLGKVPDLPDDELRQCIRTLSGGCNLPSGVVHGVADSLRPDLEEGAGQSPGPQMGLLRGHAAKRIGAC